MEPTKGCIGAQPKEKKAATGLAQTDRYQHRTAELTQVTLLRSICDIFEVGIERKSNVDGARIVAGRCSEDLAS
jgi:hypothetical protein